MSTKDAAVMLFVSPLHITKLIDEGLLPLHHHVGKFLFVRKADVLAYKERKRLEARVWLANQTEDKEPPGR
ncbi:helix-turn-helix domain-containing protein [Caballeronia sp. 15711]|uniref:helix-turn-helix domain-containing protein n=1 Tax=Caballeronia sp. 15711 TaxID=3391029 RepID=UPI0039E3099F